MKIALTNATVWESVRQSTYQGAVVVSDGRIVSTHRQGEPLPDVNRTIDVEGGTLMSGLIDCHDHQTYHNTFGPLPMQWRLPRDQQVIRSVIAACDTLRHGITSIREMGAVGATNLAIKSAQRQGVIVGPRVFSCGMPLSITGGHAFEICMEVDGIDGVRAAARQQLKDGADFVKVMASNEQPMPFQQQQTVPQFSLDELRAAADEAHDAGVRLCAHVCGSKAIERCLDAGVDSIEHGIYLNRDLAQRMKEQETFFTPTLGIYRANTYPHWMRGGAKAAFCRQLVEDHRSSMVHALDVGLRWTIGTDAIVPLVDEMQFLVDAGLSLTTVLEAVTETNAQLIEQHDQLGTLKPGMRADLIVIEGDPLKGLSALKQIRLILQDGVVYLPEQLLPMLPSTTPPEADDNLR